MYTGQYYCGQVPSGGAADVLLLKNGEETERAVGAKMEEFKYMSTKI
jgi:hypothetical protein